MDTQSNCLFITYVEKEGPFLKVWGQTDKKTALYVEQVLHSFTAQFDNGLCVPHPEALQIGILCCAKYKDSKYYRARITSLNFLHNRYIEVNFLDYGHQDVVPISNIRSLEGFENSFIAIPPQATSFLLAEAVCPRGEWNDVYLDEISKEIRYSEVNFSIIGQVTKHYLVRLFVGVNDLAILLISKGLMRHTSVTTQEAVLLSMMPRSAPQPAMQQSIATYKAFTLEPGSQYEVYVSYVTDGPCNFSVQLKQSEEVLGKLMKEINSMSLTPIEGIPIPGNVCLARCVEDGHICRAVVTNEVDGRYKVFYVDFGNFEVVPLEALYEIPFKYVIPKVMAIRFALSGVEKSTVTLDMQCAFKQFVDNRLIHMKVMPLTTRTSLPRCELWDPESHVSALDIVNQAASQAYPDHISLTRGFSQPVKVSYVFSCSRFYVQLKAKQDDLLRLMLDIQALCRDTERVNRESVKPGLPCYALFEADQQWYRSQIVEVLPTGKVKLQYVDYGNEEEVPVSALKPIEGRQLTVLRPQAIECCLNGYQNMEVDLERDNLLEELILEQEFTMKVVEMQGKKALIELIDVANYNVASLLLDKIAVTRSQVSPMLVQVGNKIEHRKSSVPKEQPPRQEQRRPERNGNSFEANEINEDNGWKQNRGFNKNNDRNKRDTEFSDSNESDRQSNKGFKNNDRNRNDINARNSDGGSWRQKEKGFNKNEDRHPRDNNRNNEWGGGEDKKNFNRNHNDWEGNKDSDRKNYNSHDDWAGKDSEKKNYHSRGKDDWGDSGEKKSRNDDDWGGRDNEKKNFHSRNKDDWGEKKSRNDDDWGGRDNEKKNFHSRNKDDWGDSNEKRSFQPRENNDWGDDGGRKGKDTWGHKDRDDNNFRKSRDRFNDQKSDWGGDSKSGGFRKRPDFKREASELSSSGSEKSFRKGFRDNSHPRSKPNFNKKFDRSPKFDDSAGGGDSWGVSTSAVDEVPDAAPSTAQFDPLSVDQTEANVILSWFHNPAFFYCQLEDRQEEFKKMMEDIQQAYKSRSPSKPEVGAPVIGLFPEDNVLYRGQVLQTVGSQYKVYYVDFGNVALITKVWPIEKRFMALPAQALCCKLEGIEPIEETWQELSVYSRYFDKQRFFCRFLATEGDRISVKLEYEGEDIASGLLGDGLAKPAVVAPPVDISLLIGVQFRAMLLSVNSLADFVVSLQSGVILNCAIFNLKQSTETWEDNLKDKLEQILIVYVDDLKDDRLEVTLYDQSGAKIKLIDRDEEAYESVELLCPYLVLNSSISGEIAHVEENAIFIQPSDCAETMEYLLNAMFEMYENTTLENPIVPVEGYVYAVKGSDTNWYRGTVVSFDDNSALINYIDYGNSENVEFSALRELVAEFLEIQTMCLSVTVNVPTENLAGQYVTVDLTFTEAGLEGTIREEPPPVESPAQAQTETVAEPCAEAAAQAQIETVAEACAESPKSCGIQVILSHADSPSDFYLQLADSITAIEELQASLQEQAAEMADMENPVVGVLCAAPYSVDQQWYRALILDADADITTVRFVDYGNTDVLDNQTTRVKTLSSSLLALEVHATRCRLKIKPTDEEWTSAASERFEQLCDVEPLTVQFIHQDEKTNYVELFSSGTNVREVLIQENLALPDEELPEAKSVAFVSHLNSPSEFWIQLENCVDELEWVAEQLSGAEGFSELEDLAPGTLCAALFPDDQMWYRARILSNTVAGIEVLFVDYGNSCTSCSLRELPEDLVMLPPLAQKCSLQRPDALTNWGPEMVRKFREVSADGQTTFNVKKLTTGETASVQLLLDGVDVATMLLPVTEEVRVRTCDGLDELVLVKGDEELPGKFKLELLPDVVWNEESTKKFAEINNQGETVFDAEFVTEDTVRLYLNLNDVRLDLSGTKTATPSSSPLKSRGERADIDDVKDIVVNIVEDSVYDETAKDMIESIVEDIIESSVDQTNEILSSGTSRAVVESIVNSFVEQTISQLKSPKKSSSNTEDDVTPIADEVASDLISSPRKDVDVSPTTSPCKNADVDESIENRSKASPHKDAKDETDPSSSEYTEEKTSPIKEAKDVSELNSNTTSPSKDVTESRPSDSIGDVQDCPSASPSKDQKVTDGSPSSASSEISPNRDQKKTIDSPSKGEAVAASPSKQQKETGGSPSKSSSEISPSKDRKDTVGSPSKGEGVATSPSKQQREAGDSPSEASSEISPSKDQKETIDSPIKGEGVATSPSKQQKETDGSPSKASSEISLSKDQKETMDSPIKVEGVDTSPSKQHKETGGSPSKASNEISPSKDPKETIGSPSKGGVATSPSQQQKEAGDSPSEASSEISPSKDKKETIDSPSKEQRSPAEASTKDDESVEADEVLVLQDSKAAPGIPEKTEIPTDSRDHTADSEEGIGDN